MSTDAYSVVTAHRASNLIYEIALQAPKGIWIVPDNVCPAVPLALACAGAEIRFVDIHDNGLCLDIDKIAEMVMRQDIVGVVYVRTFGAHRFAELDLTNLRSLLPDTILIDDCCIDIPKTYFPKTGSVADVTLFSLGYGKILDLGGGAYGFFKRDMGFKSGGQTLAPKAFENLLALSSEAIKKGEPVFADFDFTVAEFSTKNNRLAQDWSGLSQSITNQLPGSLAHKAKLNAIYAKGLGRFSRFVDSYQNWRYNIFVQNPTQTVAALFAASLFASRHYASVSRLWGEPAGEVTQYTAKNIINLFNDQYFSAKQAKQAVRIINKVGKPRER